MGQSLEFKNLGGFGGVYPWLIHSGGETLAGGMIVQLGNGVETPLFMDADGIGSRNGAGNLLRVIQPNHGEDVSVTCQRTGSLYPASRVLLSADVNSTSVTPTAVSGMSVALAQSGLYEIEGSFMVTSAATATGVQLGLSGPSGQTDWVWLEWSMITGTTLATNNIRRQQNTAWGVIMANLDSPISGTPYEIYLRGRCKISGSIPATTAQLTLNTEVAASQVTLKAGSYLDFRRLN